MPDAGKLYFDIETTGLSPAASHLTVIGAAYFDGSLPVVRQFVCERPTEEKKILADFLSFCDDFETLVHFNGRSFDIPYLKKKIAFYRLEGSFLDLHEKDLYRVAGRFAKLFAMESFKQKDYEAVFGFPRTDKLSGSDCITAYRDYLTTGSKESLHKLLLHNKEDLLGMIHIEKHLAGLTCLSEGRIRITDIRVTEEEPSEPLVIDFVPEEPFGISFEAHSSDLSCSVPGSFTFSIREDGGTLTIPAFRGELRYFFKDYKEYYYLPVEGRAVHRSVGQFVDPHYREKATKETAFEPLEAVFYPQFEEIIHPEFKADPNDSVSYFRSSDIKTEDEVKGLTAAAFGSLLKGR